MQAMESLKSIVTYYHLFFGQEGVGAIGLRGLARLAAVSSPQPVAKAYQPNGGPGAILWSSPRPAGLSPAAKCKGVDFRPAISLALTLVASTKRLTRVTSPLRQASSSSRKAPLPTGGGRGCNGGGGGSGLSGAAGLEAAEEEDEDTELLLLLLVVAALLAPEPGGGGGPELSPELSGENGLSVPAVPSRPLLAGASPSSPARVGRC